jgi:hypothetical protein
MRTSSLVEENCLQRRKIELGGDQHFLYRMAAEEWRGWVWRCVHMEEGRGAVGVGSAMEGGGVQRWQGRGRGGGGGRLGTCRPKQGKQKGGPVPWADVGEELGVWATIAAGSGQ